MKNAILTGCGLWGLAQCRAMELGAVLYILFGAVVLLSAFDMARDMLGEREQKNTRACGDRTRVEEKVL